TFSSRSDFFCASWAFAATSARLAGLPPARTAAGDIKSAVTASEVRNRKMVTVLVRAIAPMGSTELYSTGSTETQSNGDQLHRPRGTGILRSDRGRAPLGAAPWTLRLSIRRLDHGPVVRHRPAGRR